MRRYVPLMCKDCPAEIFVNRNMVMLKDSLWKKICDKHEDALCDKCIERRLGRKITSKDFKRHSDGWEMIPCNAMWLEKQKLKSKKNK